MKNTLSQQQIIEAAISLGFEEKDLNPIQYQEI